MPTGIRAACRELGIKIGYTLRQPHDLGWRQVVQLLAMFEELPWVAVLGE